MVEVATDGEYEDIEPGDLVVLKGQPNGFVMTVCSIDESGIATCYWWLPANAGPCGADIGVDGLVRVATAPRATAAKPAPTKPKAKPKLTKIELEPGQVYVREEEVIGGPQDGEPEVAVRFLNPVDNKPVVLHLSPETARQFASKVARVATDIGG